jgi:hypothetical protein
LLHPQPLAAHAVEHLQEQSAEQVPGRNRGSARLGRRADRTGARGPAGSPRPSLAGDARDDRRECAAPSARSSTCGAAARSRHRACAPPCALVVELCSRRQQMSGFRHCPSAAMASSDQ